MAKKSELNLEETRGVWEDFYDNRKAQFTIEYFNGKLDGNMKRWDETGQLIYEATFIEDELEGPFTRWYPDGIKWQEGSYKRGKLHGKFSQWQEDGEPLCEMEFTDGEPA